MNLVNVILQFHRCKNILLIACRRQLNLKFIRTNYRMLVYVLHRATLHTDIAIVIKQNENMYKYGSLMSIPSLLFRYWPNLRQIWRVVLQTFGFPSIYLFNKNMYHSLYLIYSRNHRGEDVQELQTLSTSEFPRTGKRQREENKGKLTFPSRRACWVILLMKAPCDYHTCYWVEIS